MAKFHGPVGYNEGTSEVEPGIHKEVIVERSYFGDVIRNTRLLQENENLNGQLVVNNSISIVADAYANEHFFAMRYVGWAGILWVVTTAEVQSPRIILRLGGKYNGPTPGSP